MHLDSLQQEGIAIEKLVRWIIAVTVTLRSRPHGDAVPGRHYFNSITVTLAVAQCKIGHHYSRLAGVLILTTDASSKVKHLKQGANQIRVRRLVQGVA